MHKKGTLVTRDSAMRVGRHLDPVDVRVMDEAAAGRGAPTNWAGLHALAQKAQAAIQEFREMVKEMTVEQARLIQSLRCEQAYSWRAVARTCWGEHWTNILPWAPPSNQLMGIALCEKAARLLGEDPELPPWDNSHGEFLHI